jgi:serine/threonine protein phosphatase 1
MPGRALTSFQRSSRGATIFAANKHPASPGRIIAIGDIHGCSAALAALCRAIEPRPADTVVTLGDVIDYGPDSRGVVEQLIALRERTRLVKLTGNHEEMLFGVVDGPHDLETWTTHGGDRTLASYGVDHPSKLPANHLDFLRPYQPFWESEDHGFVHAGYYPNQPLKDTPTSVLLWEFLEPKRAWPHFSDKTFVVGHTPQTSGRILDLGFLVCIDTDCSRGNWLTALDTTTGHYWQANERGQTCKGDRRY